MPKSLERDLGLPSVLAISIGAMVGSGIFILPGIALGKTGPSVVLAYLFAAVLVLPAALSKSEMATAMPEAGGTYLYIERGMGPLLGTIAGIGTWFSLTFKGALALVGGAPYLVYYLDLPVTPVALTVAAILIFVNVVGVKQTGRMQVAIVAAMLAAMVYFIVSGAPGIEGERYGGLFGGGGFGFLEATGFVFVSYAGVTKVASVAEEIEDPDRNIPLGILGSLAFTAVIYVAIVAVMVGVAPAEELVSSDVPMAVAAEYVLPGVGVVAVVVAALLALVSTANAGILSSSRYPLAMSRDALAPRSLSSVQERFGTPVNSITLTGSILLVLVAFFPIESIAKLASAFKILVFILINFALIAFRHADLPGYEPSFRTPLYPLTQIVGIAGGLLLIPFMGFEATLGAVLIIAGSLVWYFTYVRRRGDVEREGAATDAVRRWIGRQVVDDTQSLVTETDRYDVLVAVDERTSTESEGVLLRVAAAMARANDGRVDAIRFDKVPDQTPLDTASEIQTEGDVSFEDRVRDRTGELDVPVEFGEIVSHDTKHAIVNYADELGVDALVIERRAEQHHTSVFGGEIDWIRRHAPCDVVVVEDRGIEDVDRISVVSNRGPYDPAKIVIADALANEAEATVDLLMAVGPEATEKQLRTFQDYLDELEDEFTAPVSTRIVEGEDRVRRLVEATEDSDILIVTSREEESGLTGAVFGRPSERIVEEASGTTLAIRGGGGDSGGLRRFLEKRVF